MADNSAQKPLSAAAAVVRNPLSVIAMFVLLVEAIATITLVQVTDKQPIALPLVWFIVLFPTLIAIFFFGTLWWRHQFLYSPMEYRSDESFLAAMHRLQRVEARQEAAELNPRTADEAQSLQVVDRLLGLGDVRAAVKVGRTFLEVGQHEIAEHVFTHILNKTPVHHEDRYNAIANLGYAQIGLKQYKEAAKSLTDCISVIGEEKAYPWHYFALAYANLKLSASRSDSHYKEFKKHLAKGKSHSWFGDENRVFFKNLYPDMAEHL
jgi:tetratricopeptide (TPR) repeat protein